MPNKIQRKKAKKWK